MKAKTILKFAREQRKE